VAGETARPPLPESSANQLAGWWHAAELARDAGQVRRARRFLRWILAANPGEAIPARRRRGWSWHGWRAATGSGSPTCARPTAFIPRALGCSLPCARQPTATFDRW